MSILCIETSGKVCSVAVVANGGVDHHVESEPDMAHAKVLGPYVEQCIDFLTRRDAPLEAVAVSLGPGSYTGLRIGLSMAKGLCFSKEIPLIGISTLKLLACKVMFRNHPFQGHELIVPMIDARRMEVYTAVYDFGFGEVMSPCAMVLDENSYRDILEADPEREVWFVGDGVEKARHLLEWAPNARFMPVKGVHAVDMVALSELAMRRGDFMDLAYSTPEYIKEYQAVVSRNKVLQRD